MNGIDMTAVAIVAAVTNGVVLGPIVWFLLRKISGEIGELRHEVSALVVAIALDVSTRPTAGDRSREMANDLIRERVASHPTLAPIVPMPAAARD